MAAMTEGIPIMQTESVVSTIIQASMPPFPPPCSCNPSTAIEWLAASKEENVLIVSADEAAAGAPCGEDSSLSSTTHIPWRGLTTRADVRESIEKSKCINEESSDEFVTPQPTPRLFKDSCVCFNFESDSATVSLSKSMGSETSIDTKGSLFQKNPLKLPVVRYNAATNITTGNQNFCSPAPKSALWSGSYASFTPACESSGVASHTLQKQHDSSVTAVRKQLILPTKSQAVFAPPPKARILYSDFSGSSDWSVDSNSRHSIGYEFLFEKDKNSMLKIANPTLQSGNCANEQDDSKQMESGHKHSYPIQRVPARDGATLPFLLVSTQKVSTASWLDTCSTTVCKDASVPPTSEACKSKSVYTPKSDSVQLFGAHFSKLKNEYAAVSPFDANVTECYAVNTEVEESSVEMEELKERTMSSSSQAAWNSPAQLGSCNPADSSDLPCKPKYIRLSKSSIQPIHRSPWYTNGFVDTEERPKSFLMHSFPQHSAEKHTGVTEAFYGVQCNSPRGGSQRLLQETQSPLAALYVDSFIKPLSDDAPTRDVRPSVGTTVASERDLRPQELAWSDSVVYGAAFSKEERCVETITNSNPPSSSEAAPCVFPTLEQRAYSWFKPTKDFIVGMQLHTQGQHLNKDALPLSDDIHYSSFQQRNIATDKMERNVLSHGEIDVSNGSSSSTVSDELPVSMKASLRNESKRPLFQPCSKDRTLFSKTPSSFTALADTAGTLSLGSLHSVLMKGAERLTFAAKCMDVSRKAAVPLLDTLPLCQRQIHSKWGLIEIAENGDFLFAFNTDSEFEPWCSSDTPCSQSHYVLEKASKKNTPQDLQLLGHSLKELFYVVECGGRYVRIQDGQRILKRYLFSELPPRQLLRYIYGTQIVNTLKAYTPKVCLYCQNIGNFKLMCNLPLPDFIVELEGLDSPISRVELRKGIAKFFTFEQTCLIISVRDFALLTQGLYHTASLQSTSPPFDCIPPFAYRKQCANSASEECCSKSPLSNCFLKILEEFNAQIKTLKLSSENIFQVWDITLKGYEKCLYLEKQALKRFQTDFCALLKKQNMSLCECAEDPIENNQETRLDYHKLPPICNDAYNINACRRQLYNRIFPIIKEEN